MGNMIDGLISVFLGGYFFLYGSGYIKRKPPKDPNDDSFERMSPILKIGGALVFVYGVISMLMHAAR